MQTTFLEGVLFGAAGMFAVMLVVMLHQSWSTFLKGQAGPRTHVSDSWQAHQSGQCRVACRYCREALGLPTTPPEILR